MKFSIMLSMSTMGKETDLLQAIKAEDIRGITRLLAKYKSSKPSKLYLFVYQDFYCKQFAKKVLKGFFFCITYKIKRYTQRRILYIKGINFQNIINKILKV